MKVFVLPLALAGLMTTARPASAPSSFTNEQLHYSINWPSGLSLGEAQLRGSHAPPTPKSGEQLDFDFSVDAGIPGFPVKDHYRSVASSEFCSIELDRNAIHGTKKTDEKTVFDPQAGTATRETVHGGKSEISAPACAKDALDFLYYVRRELAQGRLPAPQHVFFGSEYDIRLEFAGTQSIKVGDTAQDADRLNATVKGPSSEVSFEVFFLKDKARTPALVRVPLSLGTFSMELVK